MPLHAARAGHAAMHLAARPPPPLVQLPSPRRAAALKSDLTQAFRLLQRSDSVRDFMLDASSRSADADVALLVAPRPAFTIQTEEEQVGALPGRIAMRYLGVPAFSNRAGLSGGAVVTSYTARTHPLHAPAVMADVRVGRYVRDNRTGEWCIITRNRRDRVTRLQYVRVTDAVSRERICLTCSSDLFDRGQFLASVLFQCHDREWRVCPACGSPPSARCACARGVQHLVPPVGLAAAAATVLREGPASWVGKVRVTVVSNISCSDLLDIDEYMDVRASYQPAMDVVLAADMQRLAIHEKATSEMCAPLPMSAPEMAAVKVTTVATDEPCSSQQQQQQEQQEQQSSGSDDFGASAASTGGEQGREDVGFHVEDVLAKPQYAAAGLSCLLNDASLTASEGGAALDVPDDELGEAEVDVVEEFDNSFLVGALRDPFQEFIETAMLPADPSTLPGGVELCMDGIDLAEEEEWCSSLMEQETATSSVTASSKSSASNGALQPDVCFDTDRLPSEELGQQMQLQQVQAPIGPSMSQAIPKEEAELHVVPIESKPELAPRGRMLAPRPAGMGVGAAVEGFIWQMGSASNDGGAHMLAVQNARLEAMDKERKAEERRKKNRQAAARSNARKKHMMDGIKSRIKESKERAIKLRKQELALRKENSKLRLQMQMSK